MSLVLNVDGKQAIASLEKLAKELSDVSKDATKTTNAINDLNNEIEKDTPKAADKAEREFNKLKTTLKSLSGSTGLSKNEVKQLEAVLARGLKAQTASKEIKKLERVLKAGLPDATKKAQSSLAGLRVGIGKVSFGLSSLTSIGGSVLAGLSFARVTEEIFKMGSEVIALNRAFEAITGSVGGAKAELGFLRNTSNELGLEFYKTADAYKQISAASIGTALEGEKTQRIFKAVTSAATALGLSSDKTSASLYAITQMISKGTVQSEELRRQLGEHLPGAFQMAAQAMGVTTGQLNEMLKQGKVLSADFLPKLAGVLEGRFRDAALAAAHDPRQEFNRLVTSIKDVWVTMGETGALDIMTQGVVILKDSLIDLSKWLKDNEKGIRAFGSSLKRLSDETSIFIKRMNEADWDDWTAKLLKFFLVDINPTIQIWKELKYGIEGVIAAADFFSESTDEVQRSFDELKKLKIDAAWIDIQNLKQQEEDIKEAIGAVIQEITKLDELKPFGFKHRKNALKEEFESLKVKLKETIDLTKDAKESFEFLFKMKQPDMGSSKAMLAKDQKSYIDGLKSAVTIQKIIQINQKDTISKRIELEKKWRAEAEKEYSAFNEMYLRTGKETWRKDYEDRIRNFIADRKKESAENKKSLDKQRDQFENYKARIEALQDVGKLDVPDQYKTWFDQDELAKMQKFADAEAELRKELLVHYGNEESAITRINAAFSKLWPLKKKALTEEIKFREKLLKLGKMEPLNDTIEKIAPVTQADLDTNQTEKYLAEIERLTTISNIDMSKFALDEHSRELLEEERQEAISARDRLSAWKEFYFQLSQEQREAMKYTADKIPDWFKNPDVKSFREKLAKTFNDAAVEFGRSLEGSFSSFVDDLYYDTKNAWDNFGLSVGNNLASSIGGAVGTQIETLFAEGSALGAALGGIGGGIVGGLIGVAAQELFGQGEEEVDFITPMQDLHDAIRDNTAALLEADPYTMTRYTSSLGSLENTVQEQIRDITTLSNDAGLFVAQTGKLWKVIGGISEEFSGTTEDFKDFIQTIQGVGWLQQNLEGPDLADFYVGPAGAPYIPPERLDIDIFDTAFEGFEDYTDYWRQFQESLQAPVPDDQLNKALERYVNWFNQTFAGLNFNWGQFQNQFDEFEEASDIIDTSMEGVTYAVTNILHDMQINIDDFILGLSDSRTDMQKQLNEADELFSEIASGIDELYFADDIARENYREDFERQHTEAIKLIYSDSIKEMQQDMIHTIRPLSTAFDGVHDNFVDMTTDMQVIIDSEVDQAIKNWAQATLALVEAAEQFELDTFFNSIATGISGIMYDIYSTMDEAGASTSSLSENMTNFLQSVSPENMAEIMKATYTGEVLGFDFLKDLGPIDDEMFQKIWKVIQDFQGYEQALISQFGQNWKTEMANLGMMVPDLGQLMMDTVTATMTGSVDGVLTDAELKAINDVMLKLRELTGDMSAFEKETLSINTQFNELYRSAIDAGASVQQLADIERGRIKVLNQLEEAEKNKVWDPIRDIGRDIDKRRKQRETGMSDVEWMYDQFQTLAAKGSDVTFEDAQTMQQLMTDIYTEASGAWGEAGEVWKEAVAMSEDLISSIDDTMRGIKYSDLNVSLFVDKAEEAQQDYGSLFAAAQTGDPEAVREYLDFATTYLQMSQEAYKSSQAYQDIYDQVMTDMEGMKDLVTPDWLINQGILDASEEALLTLNGMDLTLENTYDVMVDMLAVLEGTDVMSQSMGFANQFQEKYGFEASRENAEWFANDWAGDGASIQEAATHYSTDTATIAKAITDLMSMYGLYREFDVPENPSNVIESPMYTRSVLNKDGATSTNQSRVDNPQILNVYVEIDGDRIPIELIQATSDDVRVKAQRRGTVSGTRVY